MQILRSLNGEVINNHLISYPTPVNINYFWGFGALAGLCLGIQLLTGIFLAMHYTPHVALAFSSIEHIMRDVNFGWFIRYGHANGASMFFIVVYCHIGRGLFYNSYLNPREYLWSSGVVIFILMMATAFMGYVLPWGQMSFWGATVITNLFSAVPVIGETIAQWIWGGFSVDNPTLNRFFSLHYLLPFAITGLVLIHLTLLHQVGSSDPVSGDNTVFRIPFYPYFYVKDLLGFFLFLSIFSYFVFFEPNLMGHPDNYIEGNPMVTPTHIVPEWYFLPFYAMLRSIPDKLGGVVIMGLSLAILLVIPYLSNVKYLPIYSNNRYKKVAQVFFWFFIFDTVFLGWLGGQPVEDVYIFLGQTGAAYYFVYLVIILPLLNVGFENMFWVKQCFSNNLNRPEPW